MRYCKKCVMPSTRPGLIFDETGICMGCRNHEKRSNIDWEERYRKLENICEQYRKKDGYYDCIIAVSGGKDSHYLTYLMKEKMKMNPLLICVTDPFTHTEAGIHNLENLGKTFNCDTIVFKLSPEVFKRTTKIGFEKLGEPLRFIESAIYTVPFKFAVSLNIPLIIFGENSAYTYGTTAEDSYDVTRFIFAGHSASGHKLSNNIEDFWLNEGLYMEELNAVVLPSEQEIERVKPKPIFISYFIPWDDERNYMIAKKFGFKDLYHEWKREGYIEDYGQIDSVAYLVHLWMKYPKFGFARVTDISSRWIRKGLISREEAVNLVLKHDHKLDQRALDDFLSLLGYSTKQFWEIVEKFWNREIFERRDDLWFRKENVIMALKTPQLLS